VSSTAPARTPLRGQEVDVEQTEWSMSTIAWVSANHPRRALAAGDFHRGVLLGGGEVRLGGLAEGGDEAVTFAGAGGQNDVAGFDAVQGDWW